ncbi:MBL fold metallo-hydrolase, partial [Candidatus Saccharibacteria bacterium]|nr:MBL fold metallo-hydrolase [Candidatus Saccharibacteria bacterium]
MELEFFGGNCFRIKSKQTTIIIDDNLSKIGKKSVTTDKTVAFYTSGLLRDENVCEQARLVIDGAGEFEVGDITVKGIQARGHMDEEDKYTATIFQFMYDGQTITVLGHVHPDLGDDAIELVSGTDVLVMPVGGNGYTLDPIGASSIIKKVEPDVVVPSQYDIKGLNYEVPAQGLEEFGKVSSLNLEDIRDSLKLVRASEDS